jgi:hypothetical protein
VTTTLDSESRSLVLEDLRTTAITAMLQFRNQDNAILCTVTLFCNAIIARDYSSLFHGKAQQKKTGDTCNHFFLCRIHIELSQKTSYCDDTGVEPVSAIKYVRTSSHLSHAPISFFSSLARYFKPKQGKTFSRFLIVLIKMSCRTGPSMRIFFVWPKKQQQ